MNCYKNAFQSIFRGNSIISYDQFRENFQKNIQTLVKKYPERKCHVMNTFSLKNWVDLKDRQLKYSILDFDCNGCLCHDSWKIAVAMFPVQSVLQKKLKQRD